MRLLDEHRPGGRLRRPRDHGRLQKYTIETCIAKGIRSRIEIGNWEDAKPYMDLFVIWTTASAPTP